MKTGTILSGIITMLFFAPALSLGQEVSPRILGEVTLSTNSNVDYALDVVGACPSQRNPKLKFVRLVVTGGSAHIGNFSIKYGSGSWDLVRLAEPQFDDGSASDFIDLPRGLRCIDKIVFKNAWSKDSSALVKVQVQAFDHRLRPFIDTTLGVVELNPGVRSRDRIPVDGACFSNRNPGVYELQIKVTDSPAEITYFAVQFGNGRIKEYRIREHYRVNSSTRILNLPGDERCIKNIFVHGKGLGNDFSDRSFIEIIGSHY